MRRWIKNLPIRNKIVLITMAITGMALLLASVIALSSDAYASRAAMVEDLNALAAIIASNSSAALSFNDEEAAAQVLASLSARPNVVAARVYDAQGTPFAAYASGPALPDVAELVVVTHDVQVGGERVGSLELLSDTSVLRARQIRSVSGVFAIGVAALFFALALSSRLERWISARIRDLAEVSRRVSVERDYSLRVSDADGKDEVAELINVFNDMLAQIQTRDMELESHRGHLEEMVGQRTSELSETNRQLETEIAERAKLHGELVQASRRAGMAQVATNVLHNVGNVLNSVSVAASLISERVSASRSTGMAKASELLRAHRDDLPRFLSDDPAGRKLPEYLIALGKRLEEERDEISGEVQALLRNLQHIKEVVSSQQSYASRVGVVEEVSIQDVVEQALKINGAGLQRHAVDLAREFAEIPNVLVDRHRVLEVLINLISNAKYAVSRDDKVDHRVTVRIVALEGNANRVRIQVVDNGIGIAKENLTRIFSHGFTTKSDGHGFGLHSAALAIQEIGGELTVESDGPGRGSTFTLEVPVELAEGRS